MVYSTVIALWLANLRYCFYYVDGMYTAYMHMSEMQELIFPCLQPGQMIHRKMWFTLGMTEMIHAKSQRLKTKNMKYSKKYYCCLTSKASLNKMARETMNGWNNVIIDNIAGENHKENVFQFCQAASLVTLALRLFLLSTWRLNALCKNMTIVYGLLTERMACLLLHNVLQTKQDIFSEKHIVMVALSKEWLMKRLLGVVSVLSKQWINLFNHLSVRKQS